MTTGPQPGTLVLADLSGFSSYLAQTELDHARDVLTELLHLIVDHFRPTLTLAEVEGELSRRKNARALTLPPAGPALGRPRQGLQPSATRCRRKILRL